jgi:hypothetical protein
LNSNFIRKLIYRTRKIIRNSKNRFRTSEEVFTEIYEKKLWSGISKSGSGSDLAQTESIRIELPKLLKRFQIFSILDIPCGDFYWMKYLDLNSISYIGGDIVSDLIKKNNEKYSNQKRKFVIINILEDPLPKVDLILCRDLLVHFSYNELNRAIANLKKSKSKYLLTTSFVNRTNNKNITKGDWRPINLILKPFNFPPPLQIINENYLEEGEKFSDKSLCLWKISEF